MHSCLLFILLTLHKDHGSAAFTLFDDVLSFQVRDRRQRGENIQCIKTCCLGYNFAMKFIWTQYFIVYYLSEHKKIKTVDLRGQQYKVQIQTVKDGSRYSILIIKEMKVHGFAVESLMVISEFFFQAAR